MAHIETRDPFGFVGQHVVRSMPRKHRHEHGWITRYDAELDCYTLLVPVAGHSPQLVPRASVMKLVSDPNVKLYEDDQDAFPPPIEDTSSRYVGVPMSYTPKPKGRGRNRTHTTSVNGKVACFLPFSDRFRVEYEDGTSALVTESEIIDCMIAMVKNPASTPTPGGRKRSRSEAMEDTEDTPRDGVRDDASRAPVEVGGGTGTPIEIDGDVVDGAAGGSPDVDVPMTDSGHLVDDDNVDIVEVDEPMEEQTPVEEHTQSTRSEPAQVDRTEPSEEKLPPPPPRSQSATSFYMIETKPHASTEPLVGRRTAYAHLRQWLLNLLDQPDAGKKNKMQYEMLENRDIKDRDAILRFLEAEGLYVLNHLLTAFVSAETDEGDEELLFTLKVIAMLPCPTHKQVMESAIGQSIQFLVKARLPKGRTRPIPKCVQHLARWIKTKWVAGVKAPEKPAASKQPSTPPRSKTGRPSKQLRKHRLYPPQAPNIPRGPPLTAGGFPAQNRMPEDNEPIPRRQPKKPAQAPPPLSRPSNPFPDTPYTPPLPSATSYTESRAASTATEEASPTARRGSLKPDWMRKSEELSRSRFSIQNDKTAERRHYQANQSAPTQGANRKKENPEQPPSAGGTNGVYGRNQKLKFRKQWMVQEFTSTQPPVTVSRDAARTGLVPHRPPPTYRGSSSRMPRPILRYWTRYNDELDRIVMPDE